MSELRLDLNQYKITCEIKCLLSIRKIFLNAVGSNTREGKKKRKNERAYFCVPVWKEVVIILGFNWVNNKIWRSKLECVHSACAARLNAQWLIHWLCVPLNESSHWFQVADLSGQRLGDKTSFQFCPPYPSSQNEDQIGVKVLIWINVFLCFIYHWLLPCRRVCVAAQECHSLILGLAAQLPRVVWPWTQSVICAPFIIALKSCACAFITGF